MNLLSYSGTIGFNLGIAKPDETGGFDLFNEHWDYATWNCACLLWRKLLAGRKPERTVISFAGNSGESRDFGDLCIML